MAPKHPTQAQIGRMIAKHRTQRNLTQEEVAEWLGKGSKAISCLKWGVVEVCEIKVMQLADMFDRRMDELLTESSNRPNDQGQMIAGLLSGLQESDRAFILTTVEQLAAHLSSK
ncbi:helix-turn-helix domain-containing protein [Pseudomonas corrugata]|uniref:helix-turn-helix domain-containing protein n=1 Tax=Pseudomonas corrugata TaxID=47879 RepID=UPI001F523158|nr:helix-turn-helix transcriptional regulator [Pseudomonas corrugata]MCI0996310.1 helix-turn-helix transcriptional regulator [Pseudomonas corrugata]